MSLLDVLGKVRKVLGKITDLLLIGRRQGWWQRENGLWVYKKKERK